MDYDEYALELRNRIRLLRLDREHIWLLTFRLKQQSLLSSGDIDAMNLAINIIEKEILVIEGELGVLALLLGEDFNVKVP